LFALHFIKFAGAAAVAAAVSRRACYRKVRVLEADQKTDPELLAKWLADR
jgi:hypothetical protein